MEYGVAVAQLIVENGPALAGFVLPPFVYYLNKNVPDETERFWVAALTCLLVTAFLHYETLIYGKPEEFAAWVGIIFTESQATYSLYFKPRAKRIEALKRVEEQSEVITP